MMRPARLSRDGRIIWNPCGTALPLEYPQFLTPEMSRMPDFIGRDEFLEVK
jgi:hypothetical protein